MKATNILWDVDDKDELENLPTEIDVPGYMTDEDDISDYISDMTGYCHNGFALVDTVSMDINNEREIQLEQAAHDDYIHVTIWSAERNGIREVEEEYAISPGDMIMLLNWYKYQKENGNKDLSF